MSEKKKILLVEDDSLIVRIYKTRLEADGYEIEAVSKGDRVLNYLLDGGFNLVLLDIVLPGETGFEVLRKIRSNPKLKDIKVLVLSNLGEKKKVEKALKMGASGYLIKAHFKPSEVADKVKEVLDK